MTGKSSGRIVIENLADPVSGLALSWPVFISFSYSAPTPSTLNKFHSLLLVHHLYPGSAPATMSGGSKPL